MSSRIYRFKTVAKGTIILVDVANGSSIIGEPLDAVKYTKVRAIVKMIAGGWTFQIQTRVFDDYRKVWLKWSDCGEPDKNGRMPTKSAALRRGQRIMRKSMRETLSEFDGRNGIQAWPMSRSWPSFIPTPGPGMSQHWDE